MGVAYITAKSKNKTKLKTEVEKRATGIWSPGHIEEVLGVFVCVLSLVFGFWFWDSQLISQELGGGLYLRACAPTALELM